jgi:leucyl/phenylalanyl-tRNA---protein transferase
VSIDTDELLLAYRLGIFPMAEARSAKETLWVRPQERAILPLETFHVPGRLARTVRSDRFEVRVDTAFAAVIRACAAARAGRRETWINNEIIEAFEKLHFQKRAHSVEAWEDGKLAGGLYGLSLGAAFFGESMFSTKRDASKVALVHLAARLKAGGYALLDAQFPNEHLTQFSAIIVGRERFEHLLADALKREGDFYGLGSGSGAGSSSGAAGGTVAGAGATPGGGLSLTLPEAGVAAGGGAGAGALVLQLITQMS